MRRDRSGRDKSGLGQETCSRKKVRQGTSEIDDAREMNGRL